MGKFTESFGGHKYGTYDLLDHDDVVAACCPLSSGEMCLALILDKYDVQLHLRIVQVIIKV